MILQSLAGYFLIGALAWLVSEDRRRVSWRTVLAGAGLQLALAVVLLRVGLFRDVLLALNRLLDTVMQANQAGTSFVFGYLGGGTPPYAVTNAEAQFIFAFRVLPLVLFISALSALLYHWGVLPLIVRALSAIFRRLMRIGGAVALGAAANVFVGMVEAPLLIRPYLSRLSRGELFAVMTSGMATIAGTVMFLYATILAPVVPDAMGQILAASLMNAPAAIVVAALMVPPGDHRTEAELGLPRTARSSMDALTQGTIQGVQLLLNIGGMLIVLVALVSLLNQILGLAPQIGGQPLTLQRLLGWVMAPLVWLMGVPASEAVVAGGLMGTKTVLNELIAYLDLARLGPEALSLRSRLILTYAMCGFANFGSLGIMIGGMGTLVPERRAEIAELGLKSIVAGTLATSLSGAAVGVLAP
jgi:CNT family concentrative nucleoside transporter